MMQWKKHISAKTIAKDFAYRIALDKYFAVYLCSSLFPKKSVQLGDKQVVNSKLLQ